MPTLSSRAIGNGFRDQARNPNNRLIGNFLYVHTKENPRWYTYVDEYRNSVRYGGASDLDEVNIKIDSASEDFLWPLLTGYLSELVKRFGEELHTEGRKKFRHVSITLPDFNSNAVDVEVKVYTGGSTEHSQQEIAYEIMAAFSNVSVLKAVAPHYSCGRFIRKDKVGNTGPIRFFFAGPDIHLKFSHEDDASPVIVSMYSRDLESQQSWVMFQESMYSFLEEYVKTKTGQGLAREKGFRRYQGQRSRTVVEVEIRSKEFFSFTVSVPYRGSVLFPRVRYADDVMRMLSAVAWK